MSITATAANIATATAAAVAIAVVPPLAVLTAGLTTVRLVVLGVCVVRVVRVLVHLGFRSSGVCQLGLEYSLRLQRSTIQQSLNFISVASNFRSRCEIS